MEYRIGDSVSLEKKQPTVYIYALRAKREKRIFYIGSTTNPPQRMSTHVATAVRDARDPRSGHWRRLKNETIASLLMDDDLEMVIVGKVEVATDTPYYEQIAADYCRFKGHVILNGNVTFRRELYGKRKPQGGCEWAFEDMESAIDEVQAFAIRNFPSIRRDEALLLINRKRYIPTIEVTP